MVYSHSSAVAFLSPAGESARLAADDHFATRGIISSFLLATERGEDEEARAFERVSAGTESII